MYIYIYIYIPYAVVSPGKPSAVATVTWTGGFKGAVAQLVETLRDNSGGPGFDSR